MDNLTPGRWYIDRSPGHAGSVLGQRFLLIEVEGDTESGTVEVRDEFGNRRVVNRALWERDMEAE